jgi:hypothetical protein
MTIGPGRALAIGVAVAVTLAPNARPVGQTVVATGTGMVSGRVTDATTRQPVAAASVQISTVPEGPTTFPIQDCCGVIYGLNMGGDFGRSATTDADGRFTFVNLPARTFELQANKIGWAGWMWAWWGQSSPTDGARWIDLRDGQHVDGLQIALPRLPVLGGHVTDERGEPVAGISILVTPTAMAGATHRYLAQSATTDDRGTYRTTIYPGEYFVSTAPYPAVASMPVSRPTSAFPRVFFPQTNAIASAARITLAPGDERTGLDFIVAPQPVYRVSGVGEGAENLTIELFANGRLPGAAATAVGRAVQGRFGFASVPPGRYVLHALAPPQMDFMSHGTAPLAELPQGRTMWAESSVAVVDRDIDVRLALQPGARISGRVEFDGALPPPPLADLAKRTLIVERADGLESDFRGAYLTGDRFSTIQIEPGRYIVRPGPPEKWRLKSVMLGGRDISDYPVDLGQSDVDGAVITFTDRRSAIAGRLIRQGPEDLTRGWITVFPTDRAYWPEYGVYPRRIAFIECGRSGVFEAEVPPGSYYVAATRWTTRGRLSAAQLATLAASATAAVVGDSQTVHVEVRFPRVP